MAKIITITTMGNKSTIPQLTSLGITIPSLNRFERHKSPRVQAFEETVEHLGKYFYDLDTFIVKTGTDIDFLKASSKEFQRGSPALIISLKDFDKQFDLIYEHRWLFSYVMIGECSGEISSNKNVKKLINAYTLY